MRKIFNLAYVGAIALVCAGFNSCSDETVGNEVEQNPTYNPLTGEVNVNFVMNVATNNGFTRMSSANTQASLSENFRGIDNASLMTFVNKNGSGDLVDGATLATATTAAKYYNFGSILSAGALDPDGDGSSVPQSRRVIELSLPSETNILAFWGKAIKTGTSTQQGSVTWTMDKNLSNISFVADRRIPAGGGANGEDAFHQYQNLIAALLNKIVDTRHDYNFSYGGTNYVVTDFGWKDYVTWNEGKLVINPTITWGGEDHEITPLGEIIAEAFIALNTIYTGETRAGSGPAVALTLSDLYEVLQTVAGANPTSAGEALTKTVASSLQTTLGQMIDHSSKQWRTNLADLKTLSGLNEAATNLVTGDLNNFPHVTFKVPQGASILKMTIENPLDDADRTFTYSYNNAIPSYAMNGDVNSTFNPLNYRYPVELCYFGNSPIRVSNVSHETNDYPDGALTWENDASWTTGGWTKNSHVTSSTRSVAMQNNINYGVALLQTTVRYGAATLNDNNSAIQARYGTTEGDNTLSVTPGLFTLTGIMVGGVEPEMGWNYIAKSATPQFTSYIYDSDLPSTAIPTSGKSTPNYTLVWDNWNPASKGAKQNVVYIALEFVNNSGKDFWGMHNLIRNGQTFYITGKLDPDKEGSASPLSTTDRSEGITWPTNYALPPYNADGTTIKERRIFIQDYKTVADFVIGANSLKSALVDVPDLRSSQISLGLSVDLQWEAGLNFEEVILGQ